MALYDANIVQKSERWFIGIFSINRYEWMVSDLGAGAHSIANVALYDTLGPETSEFIINHSELPIIVTTVDKVEGLLVIANKCPTLKVIIVMESHFKDQVSPLSVLQKWGEQLGIKVISFNEVLKLGKQNPRQFRLPKPEDLFCISYTSGTTGNPKGAMLSHRNMICTLRTQAAMAGTNQDDIHISYLPLAHIFERVMIWIVASVGASAGFFRGDGTFRLTSFFIG
jgi:long-chain acyl-CoA synthetase